MTSETALQRFLRYVTIDTQSDPNSENSPSTTKQFDLAWLLVKELRTLGLADAICDDYCHVTATLPSHLSMTHVAVPTIGWIAHLDTSPDVTGANVKPRIIEKYDGDDIVLNADSSVVIRVSENAKLKTCIGHQLVTTDGTTLLGADDKAGIAAIMTAVEHLLTHPEIPHGTIRIAFTPDEEVGRGTEHFDIAKFGAKYAYTVDGDLPGELNHETFSANAATITVQGKDIHPGSAKNVMISAIRVVADLIAGLPAHMAPETTEGYEPFIHPTSVEGATGKATLKLILRDFKTEGLNEQKRILENLIANIQKKYPKAGIDLKITETYRNMREKLDQYPEVLDCLWKASERAGVEPFWHPIRGGTDGSGLTAKGLPTPNIYTGGQNFHSRTEWLSVQGLEQSVKTLLELAQVWVEKSQ
ncbi:peptidase T [Bdellovibrionota bacterium FG-1]